VFYLLLHTAGNQRQNIANKGVIAKIFQTKELRVKLLFCPSVCGQNIPNKGVTGAKGPAMPGLLLV
jgi:hypothetical protein